MYLDSIVPTKRYLLAFPLTTLILGSAFLDSIRPRKTGRIEIRQEWVSKGLPGAEFTNISGMAEGSGDSVWVSDVGSSRIVALARSGGGGRIIARKGGGPGEVEGPTFIARRQSGGMAIYDVSHMAVELFSRSGGFERRVSLERRVMNPKGFVVLSGDTLVISGGIPTNVYALHRFSSSGTLERSWHPAPRSEDDFGNLYAAGGPLTLDRDRSLLYSEAAPHRIIRFANNATVGRTVAEDRRLLRPVAEHFSREENGWRTFRWWFPQSKGVFVLPDGRLLNVICNAEDGYSVWEVYSRDGRRQAVTRVDRPYSPWGLARDGSVLASYQDPETDEYVATRLRIDLH